MPRQANNPRSDTTDLDQLIAAVASGSTDALERLYRLTGTGVYSFALSILKNSMDAEDVLQDCYIQIHRAAGSYKSQRKPMAWILTITKNLCYRRLRDANRAVTLAQYDRNSHLAEDQRLDAEDRLVLQGCMELLTDEERQIVVLHVVSGLKHRQIAELMDLKLSTVLSKYRRAIEKMKNHF